MQTSALYSPVRGGTHVLPQRRRPRRTLACLDRAKREGDLPQDADPAELARYVMTVVRGTAVQSASGASPDQLLRVAQVALRAWPKR